MDNQRPLVQLGLYYYLEYSHPRVHLAIFDTIRPILPSTFSQPLSCTKTCRQRRIMSRLLTGRWAEHMTKSQWSPASNDTTSP